MNKGKLYLLILCLGIAFSEIDLAIPENIPEIKNNREDLDLLIGIMVEFQEEVNDESSF